MKPTIMIALISIAIMAAYTAPAVNSKSEDRGMALFNDPKLGNGTSGNSCGTCHPDGKGLDAISSKKKLMSPAEGAHPLEDMVNRCITMALKGEALDVNSGQMKDLVSYMKNIKAKEDKTVKKKRASVGC